MRSVVGDFRHRRGTTLSAGCGLVASLVFLGACYSTRPIHAAAPAVTTRIVGHLSQQASRDMERLIGRDAVAVEGIVSEIRDDEWDLRVLRVDQTGGRSVRWNNELVSFPNGAFTSVAERRLEKTRSGLFAGGMTVAAIVLGKVLGLGGLFAGGGDGDPGPVQ